MIIKKYRKKPIVVEAYKWADITIHTESIFPIEYPPSTDICEECGQLMMAHGRIKTLAGYHIVCPGDYIITGIAGEKYPCKPHIFELTYEEIRENNNV